MEVIIAFLSIDSIAYANFNYKIHFFTKNKFNIAELRKQASAHSTGACICVLRSAAGERLFLFIEKVNKCGC